jgi:chromosome segregation ATPase
MTSEENILLKRQLEELREQLNTKDLDLKKYHRTISDLEQQLTEAENVRRKNFFFLL